VLYIFCDKDAEQRFLVDRYRSRRNLLRSPSIALQERLAPRHRDRAAEKYETYREPLERLWELRISLGRTPDKREVEDLLPLTEGFGTLAKALRFIEARKDPEEIDCSRDSRIADLKVYFALNQFERVKIKLREQDIDYFGMIRLTYGFCSPELAKEIPGRIDPKRDQHAAHELNRLGNPVCERLGAAVDFIVDDESMLDVAQWVVANTPFDRLYFYGDNQPIHVSHGPEQVRQVVRMAAGPSGRLIPRVTAVEEFLSLL
jgi:hypothetical protein